MLANGFTLGNAPMGSPNSISIAATQITQIMKDVASSQYGGQTANRADENFVEYARKDYDKFLEQAHEIMPDDLPIEIAERQVRLAKDVEPKRLHFEKGPSGPADGRAVPQGCQPFAAAARGVGEDPDPQGHLRRHADHGIPDQLNRVSNGQTPFVTVGFGLGTDWFAREIQRAIFLNRIRGLGSEHHTAIFPKLVFTIKHGVNADPGDPNYDLKQLALECATKRMYPDVIFYENIVKITGSFKAPMGCRSFLQGWIDPATGKDVEDGRMNLWRRHRERSAHRPNPTATRIASGRSSTSAWPWLIRHCNSVSCVASRPRRSMRQPCSVSGAFGRLGANDSVDQLFRNERATVSPELHWPV